MSRKTGKLSKTDEEYIVRNIHSSSLQDIANKLNRNLDPIKRFVERKKLVAEPTIEEVQDRQRLLSTLHSKPYWKSIVESYTVSEVEYFEGNWMAMVTEFNEELTVGEETHLKDWLCLQIQINRLNKDQKMATETIQRLESEIISDQARLAAIDNPMDTEHITIRQSLALKAAELGAIRASTPQYISQHAKLVDLAGDISKLLKATREKARDIKVNEDTYWGYIQLLEDEKQRKIESRQAEILRVAMNTARKRLGSNHMFMDGVVDKPLLSAETVFYEDEIKEDIEENNNAEE